jgi:hypothetical protein
MFTLSRERATELGGKKQGDHVTPYSIFLRMIARAIETKDVDVVKDNLKNLFGAVLPNYSEDFSREISEKFDTRIGKSKTREQRKALTARLRLLGAAEEDIDVSKSGLIDQKAILTAELIIFLSTTLLQKINRDDNMCFASEGKVDSKQGSVISKAINALTALDRFLGLSTETDIEYFFEDISKPGSQMLSGIRQFFNITSKYTHLINSPVVTKQEKGGFLQEVQAKISDPDFYQDILGKSISNLFDFEYPNHFDAEDVENILYKVCTRHLVIVLHTFSNLCKDTTNKEKIIDGFLNDVLQTHGWNELNILRQGMEIKLDLESFREGIYKHMDLQTTSIKPTQCFQAVLNFGDTTREGGVGL